LKQEIYKLNKITHKYDELSEIDEIKWIEIKEMMKKIIDNMENCNGLKKATSTKILHKIRPGLFPILDSRVISFYDSDNTIELIERIREDIKKSDYLLDYIKEKIPRKPKITKTRRGNNFNKLFIKIIFLLQ